METRKKLSAKQVAVIKGASERQAIARLQADAAQQELNTVVELIRDVHNVPEGAQIRLDEATHDLVVTVPDPVPEVPKAPETPKT